LAHHSIPVEKNNINPLLNNYNNPSHFRVVSADMDGLEVYACGIALLLLQPAHTWEYSIAGVQLGPTGLF
jgi:hypothetical protein